jgi:hypothetical protein
MRVLVCGGRDFGDYSLVCDTLNQLLPEINAGTTIISGAARGADALGERWAHAARADLERYPADWEAHGRSAGPIRNRQMLVEGKPDLVVAFAGGKGTANMIKQARAAGVKVIEVV